MIQERKQFKPASIWEATIEQWRLSGISARKWCQKNAIPYTTFIGWRTRLQRRQSTSSGTLSSTSFVEIVENPTNKQNAVYSGVAVEFQGIHIHLAKEFDRAVLQSCIKALKEDTCYR